MKPSLLIRADDSAVIGCGHAMRCCALAQEWVRRGGRVLFVAAQTTPAFLQRLADEGIESCQIAADPGSLSDAEQTVTIARSTGANWVVADGYRFGLSWQRAVKSTGLHLMVLDDHDFCETFCTDILLNQNVLPEGRNYDERALGAKKLIGSRYVLLRREFLGWAVWQREIPAVARKILVTLGGADPDNVTEKVIEALRHLKDIEAVVVIGGANRHIESLTTVAATLPSTVKIEVNSQRMAEHMAWADVAISAGGSTSWELAFMGLPTIQCVLADNQADIASELHRLGVTINLGDHTQITVEKIESTLSSLLADTETRKAMSVNGRKLVDGHGAARVCAALGAPLQITLVSDINSWINDYLPDLRDLFAKEGHSVRWVHLPSDIPEGDIAFLLSLGRVVPPDVLRRNIHNLVVHESALPQGRGWSPLTWQILAGANQVPVTLLEAGEGVDTGDIYANETIQFRGDELVDELRSAQVAATVRLCWNFLIHYPISGGQGRPQIGEGSTYPRRRPENSRMDPDKTVREQFELLRVSDPDRYPAFFDLRGYRYEVRITKKPIPSS